MKDIKVNIIRSNRKSFAVQVYPDLSVVLRVPMRAAEADIDRILNEKEGWIKKHIDKIKAEKNNALLQGIMPLEASDIQELTKRAASYIPSRAEYFAPIVGVDYGRITIRKQKTRWGSCSSKRNLNFNCLLMLAPLEVLDYVVVHELCHIKQMNHSKEFWNEVEKVIPDYKKWEGWLKNEGRALMNRTF